MKDRDNTETRVVYKSYEYKANRRDMSTPYYAAYKASRNARPLNSSYASKMRSVADYARRPMPADDSHGAPAQRPVQPRKQKQYKPVPARRAFWAFLVVLFTLLYIAVPVLNYLQIGGLASVNKYFDLFDRVDFEERVDEDGNVELDEEGNVIEDPVLTNLGTEDIVMGFIKGLTPATTEEGEEVDEGEEAVAEAAEEAAPEADATEATEGEEGEEEAPEEKNYFYYDEYMSKVGEAEMLTKIAYYGLPVALVLGVVIALVFFIRAVICLCGKKRRKLFVLSSIMMLVFTLLGIVFGFMATGAEWAQIVSFVTFKNELTVQLGYGYAIMAGLSLLTLIASCFAFRSKQKVY